MNYTTERTRRHIILSLINLLRKQPFTVISIQEICEEALIHRSTFYRYYKDKIALLEDLIYYIVDQLLEQSKQKQDGSFHILVDFIEEDLWLFEHILLAPEGHLLIQSMTNIAAEMLYHRSKTEDDIMSIKIKKAKYPYVVSEMYAVSFMTIIQNWISKKYDFGKNELFEIFHYIIEE